MNRAALYVVFCFALMVTACSTDQDSDSFKALPGDDKVLARVNDSTITRYDLELSMTSTLGAQGAKMLDDGGKKSMLDSLVAARAIAQAQEKTLTARDRAVLDKQTAAYREQLLVKMYLAQNTTAEPVSQQMVADYYQQHPEQFGAKTIKQYEVINSQAALTDALRDKLLAALQNADRQKDWAAWSTKLKRNGLDVVYKSGNADPAILGADLRSQLGALQAGQSASLSFTGGQVSLARVTGEKKIAPRPLKDVSAQIRKALLPVQLKKAVKQASDQVLTQAKVQYLQE
jgi:hypothetical protein